MREHIAILKRLGAHQRVIDIAEQVLREYEQKAAADTAPQ
jgi:hypothetical protein